MVNSWRRTWRLNTGAQVTLRHATLADAERLLEYVEQIAGESDYLLFGPGEFGVTLEEERAYLQRHADMPSALFLIAEIAGELVGTLSFSAGARPRQRHVGEFGMAVRRTYWNLGIGRRMLAELIAWAGRQGTIRKLNLRVCVENQGAIHLYEQLGFVQEGRLTRELLLHGQLVDVWLMGLPLDPP
jgi:RimJ/RimL family protein N-acetyltransferase